MFQYDELFMVIKQSLHPALLYKHTDNVKDVEKFFEINPILEDYDYDEILTRYLMNR